MAATAILDFLEFSIFSTFGTEGRVIPLYRGVCVRGVHFRGVFYCFGSGLGSGEK